MMKRPVARSSAKERFIIEDESQRPQRPCWIASETADSQMVRFRLLGGL